MATVTKPDEQYFAAAERRDVQTFLKTAQTESRDLYKHLSKVMTHVVQHCPEDGLNKLEEISHLTKEGDDAKTASYLKTSYTAKYSAPADEKTAEMTEAVSESTAAFFVSNS